MSNGWNDFQKASKGQFGSSQEPAAVPNAWDQGTFPTKTASILYHFGKHGNGRTLARYTADAEAFWTVNRGTAMWGTWNSAWAPSYKLKMGSQGGYFNASAQILT
jgi:hypothetical protein